LSKSLTDELIKEDNRLVLASKNLPKQFSTKNRKISRYDVNPGDEIFLLLPEFVVMI
jgi:hypothetical protein